jgi:hypothetical protein
VHVRRKSQRCKVKSIKQPGNQVINNGFQAVWVSFFFVGFFFMFPEIKDNQILSEDEEIGNEIY